MVHISDLKDILSNPQWWAACAALVAVATLIIADGYRRSRRAPPRTERQPADDPPPCPREETRYDLNKPEELGQCGARIRRWIQSEGDGASFEGALAHFESSGYSRTEALTAFLFSLVSNVTRGRAFRMRLALQGVTTLLRETRNPSPDVLAREMVRLRLTDETSERIILEFLYQGRPIDLRTFQHEKRRCLDAQRRQARKARV